MRASHPGKAGKGLVSVRPFVQDGKELRPDVSCTGGGITADADCGKLIDAKVRDLRSGENEIGGKTQIGDRIDIGGVAGQACFEAEEAIQAVSQGKDFVGAKGVSVIQGKDMIRASHRTAIAGVRLVLKTVEGLGVSPLLRILAAQKIGLIDAVVDLDVELIVAGGRSPGSEPIGRSYAGGW